MPVLPLCGRQLRGFSRFARGLACSKMQVIPKAGGNGVQRVSETQSETQYPTIQFTRDSDLSRLSQADDGGGGETTHAIHQPCGTYLLLRNLRDYEETDGEGILELPSLP